MGFERKKVDLIIQARMGSTRLPGKSLFDLAGEPLVGRILERVKKCKNIDDIILAIPDSKENLPLKDLALKYSVKVYQGSENDLVERYYKAAKKFKSEYVCRLPADNPTPEYLEIDKMIAYHLKSNKSGFSTNLAQVNGSGYPDGIGVEIFNVHLLKEIFFHDYDSQKREHLHLNFFNYESGKAIDSEWCPVHTIQCPKEYSRPDLILDVNTNDQYLFMKNLYEYLYPKNQDFGILEIIDWYDNVYKKS